MDTRQLINYLQEVESATPENAQQLYDRYPQMVLEFRNVQAYLQNLIPRLPHPVISNTASTNNVTYAVRRFIARGFSSSDFVDNLDFVQEFFRQIAKADFVNPRHFQGFCAGNMGIFSDEAFAKVDPADRYRLLQLLLLFLYNFCYVKRYSFFQGLAFSIHSNLISKEEFSSRVSSLRQQGYSDNDIEIIISLEYNTEITYIVFPEKANVHETNLWMSRLAAFAQINKDIVIINHENFWMLNAPLVTQDQLDALPATQKLDIPASSVQVLLEKGLVL